MPCWKSGWKTGSPLAHEQAGTIQKEGEEKREEVGDKGLQQKKKIGKQKRQEERRESEKSRARESTRQKATKTINIFNIHYSCQNNQNHYYYLPKA